MSAIRESYVCFVEAKAFAGTTKKWNVNAASDDVLLGIVKWFGRWRCYAFFPVADTVFEHRCLRDIAAFCEAKTDELRSTWPKRKAHTPLVVLQAGLSCAVKVETQGQMVRCDKPVVCSFVDNGTRFWLCARCESNARHGDYGSHFRDLLLVERPDPPKVEQNAGLGAKGGMP